jgi:hypothetical protein
VLAVAAVGENVVPAVGVPEFWALACVQTTAMLTLNTAQVSFRALPNLKGTDAATGAAKRSWFM